MNAVRKHMSDQGIWLGGPVGHTQTPGTSNLVHHQPVNQHQHQTSAAEALDTRFPGTLPATIQRQAHNPPGLRQACCVPPSFAYTGCPHPAAVTARNRIGKLSELQL